MKTVNKSLAGEYYGWIFEYCWPISKAPTIEFLKALIASFG